MIDAVGIAGGDDRPVLVFELDGQSIELGEKRIEFDISLVEVDAFHRGELSDAQHGACVKVTDSERLVGRGVRGDEPIVVQFGNVHDNVRLGRLGEGECFQLDVFDAFEAWGSGGFQVDGERKVCEVRVRIPRVDE